MTGFGVWAATRDAVFAHVTERTQSAFAEITDQTQSGFVNLTALAGSALRHGASSALSEPGAGVRAIAGSAPKAALSSPRKPWSADSTTTRVAFAAALVRLIFMTRDHAGNAIKGL